MLSQVSASTKVLTVRPLSFQEVGNLSPERLPALENILVIAGVGELSLEQLQKAAARAAAANPVANWRAVRNGKALFWADKKQPPAVRIVDDCQWDGRSAEGAEFIQQQPLCAYKGPVGEVILAKKNETNDSSDGRVISSFLIFRSLHAAMDGVGCLHFVRDFFRVLNKQQLQGSDTLESAAELAKRQGFRRQSAPVGGQQPLPLAQPGNRWHWARAAINDASPWPMARVAAALRQCFLPEDAGSLNTTETLSLAETLRLQVPVNLRRFVEGKYCVLNYANPVAVGLTANQGAAEFNRQLVSLVNQKVSLIFSEQNESMLDDQNQPLFEADLILSDLGQLNAEQFSCESFAASAVFSVPQGRQPLCILTQVNGYLNITLGMPVANGNPEKLHQILQGVINALQ